MENTAKNFALQLGSLISLYISIGALVNLLFGVITVLHPDPAAYVWEAEGATASIRTAIAMLIVFFPTYIVLTRLVNTVRRAEKGTYLTLTKWLIYISLLVGGGVVLGDLVAVLIGFLNGELTIRFILKAITVFVVVMSACVYYILDARGHWQTHEKQSIQYAGVTSLIVLIAIIGGFMHTESPVQVREMRIDTAQLSDLQNIQYRIEEAYRVDATLPTTIDAVFIGIGVPVASEGRDAYTYTVTSPTSFELCAEFAYPSSKSEQMQYAQPMTDTGMIIKNPYNWDHGTGNWCFERIVEVLPFM